MNRKNRGILIGMVLGDGYIKKDNRKNNSFALVICHSKKQEEYCIHKYNIIKSIFGGKFNVNYYDHFLPSTGLYYPQCRFSKGNSYFRILHNWMYPDNKKTITRKILNYLTPQGIAYWYQDDGSSIVNNRKGDGSISSIICKLHTCCSKEEVDIIIDYFKEIWKVSFKPIKEKGNFSISASTKEAKKFYNIISHYVVPSMEYKIKLLVDKSAQPHLLGDDIV